MNWLRARLNEPSTYAGLGVVVVSLGVLYDALPLVWGGIVAGGMGFVLTDKDNRPSKRAVNVGCCRRWFRHRRYVA